MVKTITITDSAYKDLVSIKDENESFSEFFERLVKEVGPIAILMKLRGSVEFKDKGKMLKEIKDKRAERRE